MKKVLFMLVITCHLMSCNSKKKEEITKISSDDTENIIAESDSLGQITLYEGLLPCADCSGIETVLKIYHGDGTIESHRFELSSVYKGESGKKFEQKGNYNVERGLGNDPDGTIYILNYDKPEGEQIFYGYSAATPNKIYMLDNKKEIIKSKLDYSLTLKKEH